MIYYDLICRPTKFQMYGTLMRSVCGGVGSRDTENRLDRELGREDEMCLNHSDQWRLALLAIQEI